MSSLKSIWVSIFANAKSRTPQDVDLATVLGNIRSGHYQKKILALREIRVSNKNQYNAQKTQLPAFTVSGTAKTRKEAGEHSNLIQVDLDALDEQLPELRKRLGADPHVAFGFVSPSGQGLKLGVLIDGNRHAESYRAVETYFHDTYDVKIDPACKDRLRLCFVSHDPELWLRDDPTPMPLVLKEAGQGGGAKGDSSESCVLNNCEPTSLNTCIAASLHNTSDEIILTNITVGNEARKAFLIKHPGLAKLYAALIEQRFQAKAQGRNDFIKNAVPFLYRAVAEQFITELVGHFYDCNRAFFRDPRDQHMREAQAMLKAVAETYAAELSVGERKIYAALPDERERDAFRICRDLSFVPNANREPSTFFLAFNHLADRLGVFPTQAQRILRNMAGCGLLELLQKGTRRAAGVRGEATIYKWLLANPNQKTSPQNN